MGIVIFGVGGLYLALLVLGTASAARVAKRKGRNPWLWGGVAGLAIYLPVFWDHIPTALAHKYYCSKDAGFQVYKTVEQWKAENPGVADSLTWRTALTDYVNANGALTQTLNERFVIERTSIRVPFLSTRRHEYRFVDVKSGETVAKRVTVTSGYANPALGGGARGWKFWLSFEPCVTDIQAYGTFFRAVHQMGTKK